MNSAPRIWINAGEPSGDQHGALLARALLHEQPNACILGMGGEALIAAGQHNTAHISELSVMGFTEVLGQLPGIVRLLQRIKRELQSSPPDVLVLIDAPDFNFRLAKMASRLGIPVVYYISPKIWAWRKGRARFIKRHVTRMLCILPFEQEFYRQYGVAAHYVGNPLLDAIDWERMPHVLPDPNQIGLLPGSRKKELRALLPEFLAAARMLHEKHQELHFALGRAPGVSRQGLNDVLARVWPGHPPVTIVEPEKRHEMMRSSSLCLAASGTVTLETALLGTPTIVAYKLSSLTFALARRVVRVPYISLPNLILQQPVFPEHLQENADAAPLAAHALRWLETPGKLDAIRGELVRLQDLLGPPGAPERAARCVLEVCDRADRAKTATA